MRSLPRRDGEAPARPTQPSAESSAHQANAATTSHSDGPRRGEAARQAIFEAAGAGTPIGLFTPADEAPTTAPAAGQPSLASGQARRKRVLGKGHAGKDAADRGRSLAGSGKRRAPHGGAKPARAARESWLAGPTSAAAGGGNGVAGSVSGRSGGSLLRPGTRRTGRASCCCWPRWKSFTPAGWR